VSGGRGFTLLELLVSMTLLALVLGLLFGGLRTGTRVWEESARRGDDLARLQAVHGFLRRQLGELQPLAQRQRNLAPRSTFSGAREEVSFTGFLPAHFGFAGFQVIGLGVVEDDDGRHLGVWWYPFDPDGEPPPRLPEEQRTLLIEDVDEVEFAYYGAPGRRAEPQWNDLWEDMEHPPRLVRLRVAFADGDPRTWPELVVRPAIEGTLLLDREDEPVE
jgi:general secretion pathway protein J